jgi:hypothetical protein
MFIELISPEPKDIICTRDRIKLRIAEPQSGGRFWVSLTFSSESELSRFSEKLIEIISRPREYNAG